MGRRVLLTGATGLLGSYLLDVFSADPSIDLLATRRKSTHMPAMKSFGREPLWLEGDLLDRQFLMEAVQEVDAIVHAAGAVSYKKKDELLLKHTNVRLVAEIADAALAAGVKHFIHLSSIAAISPAQREAPISESYLSFYGQGDTSRYARSKFDGELHVWRAAEEGLPVTILNPSVILGAGDWKRSSAQLFAWVAKGQRYYPPGGTGYVDARDVAAFAKTCFESGACNERYILNAANWSFKHFFDTVAAALGIEPPKQMVSATQAELAWRVSQTKAYFTGRPDVLTRESARRSMVTLSFDNSKSLAAGATYRPLETSIQDVAAAYQASMPK